MLILLQAIVKTQIFPQRWTLALLSTNQHVTKCAPQGLREKVSKVLQAVTGLAHQACTFNQACTHQAGLSRIATNTPHTAVIFNELYYIKTSYATHIILNMDHK